MSKMLIRSILMYVCEAGMLTPKDEDKEGGLLVAEKKFVYSSLGSTQTEDIGSWRVRKNRELFFLSDLNNYINLGFS